MLSMNNHIVNINIDCYIRNIQIYIDKDYLQEFLYLGKLNIL